tara:strand:+ start:46 stop:1848 length:1803 start_codon:yes stop_codon:yes gene_type:complete
LNDKKKAAESLVGRWFKGFGRVCGILSPSARRRSVFVLAMMLVGMALETLGIGLVIPAISILMQESYLDRFPTVDPWLEALGNPTHAMLVTWGLLILAMVYLCKNLFLAFQVRRQARFAFGVQEETSFRLFEHYLRRPYVFHLKTNTSQLIRNVVGEVNSFSGYVLQPCMILLTEIFVMLAVLVLLLWVEPLGTAFLLLVLGSVAWLYHRITRKSVASWGKERQKREGLKLLHLQQGLGGIKDIKLFGCEQEFLARYKEHNRIAAIMGKRQLVLQQLPKLGIEMLAVLSLVILALALIGQERPVETALPVLAMLAAAAFRLIPSFSRILNAIQSIRFGWPCVQVLENEIDCKDQEGTSSRGVDEEVESLPFEHEISFSEVNYRYPASDKSSLQDVSIRIPKGASVGIVGESGSGKSTLVDVMLGLLDPQKGSVLLDGKKVSAKIRSWQNRIGYVPQEIYLTDDSLRNNVAFGLSDSSIDDDCVWKALRSAQLEDFARELPEGLDTSLEERGVRLSGGQRQRVGIARALYHNPSVLVLDEATSSLDEKTEDGIMEAVGSLKGEKTFVIVAHRLSTVKDCDLLYRLEDGKIVSSGSFDEVIG